ncbi:hypothetical protein NDU88_004575 [Pleurodeles waltl]|uniref:Uncharacterized protein n=1 Tax=Pleurodeles waltl TaxID=8319 RepID=A0AAV7M8L4_PLEWA|nr:hypothetical protein NDU88_004575 [Pleurodeles waltl]
MPQGRNNEARLYTNGHSGETPGRGPQLHWCLLDGKNIVAELKGVAGVHLKRQYIRGAWLGQPARWPSPREALLGWGPFRLIYPSWSGHYIFFAPAAPSGTGVPRLVFSAGAGGGLLPRFRYRCLIRSRGSAGSEAQKGRPLRGLLPLCAL